MSGYKSPETVIDDVPVKRQKTLGIAVGRILLHATEKQAIVDDLIIDNLPFNSIWSDPTFLDKTDISVSEWLIKERARQKDKLAWRKYDAELLLKIGMTLRVTGLLDGVVTTGEPRSIDLRAATIAVADRNSEARTNITYAELVPPPSDIAQSYFAHRLIVNFDVLSIPHRNERFL